MREGHLRRRLGQPCERRRERDGILRREPALRARGERRGPEAEVAVALLREPFAQPARSLLHPPVLRQPPCELLRGLLGLELGELGALVGEELPRLDLEQRGDEHEELAASVEVDPVARGQVLDEGDHDRRDVDLRGLELLLEDERQEEVERPLERIEVQLEIANRRRHGANLAGRSDAPLARDGHPPLRLRRPRAASAACERGPVALREDVPRDAARRSRSATPRR